MPFQIRALSRFATSSRQRRERSNVYVYTTEDTAADVKGAGYFNAALDRFRLRVGDVIDVTAGVLGSPAMLRLAVVSVVAGVVGLGDVTGGAIAKHAFGNRMVLPTQFFTSTSAIAYHAAHMVDVSPSWNTRSPQMAFSGWYNNEIPLGNDYLVEGAWIEIGTVKYDLTVNGQTSFVVPNGGFVWTDENDAIKVPANTVVRWGWANYAAVGLNRARGGPVILPVARAGTAEGRGDMVLNAGTSQLATAKANTTGNQVATPGAADYYSPPVAFIAKPDGAAAEAAARSALMNGDSTDWGANVNTFVYAMNAAEGWAQGGTAQALGDTAGGRIPRINFCVPGTRLPDLGPGPTGETTVNGYAGRRAILAAQSFPYSTVHCGMGINTVAAETGTAQQIVDAVTAKAMAAWQYQKTQLGGRKLIQRTMTPQTDSVNSGTSTANYQRWASADESKQNLKSDLAHTTLDNLILSKPAPLDDVIDVRPYLESSAGSRKWKAPTGQQGTLTAATSAGDLTFQMTGWLPKLGEAIMVDPNDTQNLYDSPIVTAVAGDATAATITVRNAAALGKAHASGAPVCGIMTNDGTHETMQGAVARKAATIADKAKFV